MVDQKVESWPIESIKILAFDLHANSALTHPCWFRSSKGKIGPSLPSHLRRINDAGDKLSDVSFSSFADTLMPLWFNEL